MAQAAEYQPLVLAKTDGLSREAWLAYRRQGLGGSDAASVLRLSPFRTAMDLYYDKWDLPIKDDEGNWVAMEVGTLPEDLVARIFVQKTGLTIYRRKCMFQHPHYPWMLTDLDFLVEMPDGSTALLEFKTTNYNARDKWEYDGKPIVPICYEAQGRQYMAVMNLNRVYYCCLYGNNEDEVIIRHIDRDRNEESELIFLERDFWMNNVQAQVPPPYLENDGELILESLRRRMGPSSKDAPPVLLTPPQSVKMVRFLELLRKSPFRLCQIPGFGFRRVDAIVQKSGGDLHDPMRVQGALFYTLEKSRTEGGHLYLGAEALVKSALLLLNEEIPQPDLRLERQQVERELKAMIMSDVVAADKGNIYVPHVFAQESETACKVVQMLLEVPEPVNLAPVMGGLEDQLGIQLSPKQYEGVEMVFRHNLSIITGGPGTGKSTILKAVIEAYRQVYPKNTIMLGAPTGKAGRRMAKTTGMDNAQTLHSLLGLHGEDTGWRKRSVPGAD